MAYIKQTWVDDETPITADKMNHIEDGIGEVEASLTQQISLIQGGTPTPVSLASAMTDTSVIYLYTGTEEGYESGHWYYYNGTEWTDGGQYGADGGINTNARNILKYILERVAYTETGMQTYVNALYQALAQSGGGGGSETTTYMIMNALTNVTNSNDATGCNEGDSYTATLTADTDYSIDSVVVTMGGTDITNIAYSNGTITIASVTGDVLITASAHAYLYQLPAPVTFTGDASERITPQFNGSNIQLLNTDIDFTITASITRSTSVTNGAYVFQCMQGTSPYFGIKLQTLTAQNKYSAICNGQTINTDISANSTGAMKVVVRHTAGASNSKWSITNENNVLSTYDVGNTVNPGVTGNLLIGGNGYSGTINDFTLYDRVLTDNEVLAYLQQ